MKVISFFFLIVILISNFLFSSELDKLKKINSLLKRVKKKKNVVRIKQGRGDISTVSSSQQEETSPGDKLVRDIKPFLEIGKIQLDLGNYDEAQKQFEKAILISPQHPEPYYYLGILYQKKYQYALAIEYFKKALSQSPDYQRAKNALVSLYSKYEKQLKKELKTDPNFPNTYDQLAYLYIQQGKLDLAEKNLKKALSLNPKDSIAYDYLGVLYYKKNQLEKAYLYTQKAFQLDPESEIIYNHYQELTKKLIELGKDPLSLKFGGNEKSESSLEKRVAKPVSLDNNFLKKITYLLKNYRLKEVEKIVDDLPSDYQNYPIVKQIRKRLASLKEKLARYNDYLNKLKKEKNWKRKLELFSRLKKESFFKKLGKNAYLLMVKLALEQKDFNFIKVALQEIPRLYGKTLSLEEKGYLAKVKKQLNSQKGPSFWKKIKAFKDYLLRIFSFSGKWVKYVGYLVGILILAGIIYFKLPFVVKKRLFQKLNQARKERKWAQLKEIGLKLSSFNLSSTEKYLLTNNLLKAYYETGDYERAKNLAESILKKDPRNRMVKEIYVYSCAQLDEINDGNIAFYLEILKYDFANSKLIELICDYYLKFLKNASEKQLEKVSYDTKVIDIFRKMVRDNPGNLKVIKILGKLFMLRKKTDSEAIGIYEKLLEFEPKNLELHKLLAQAYFNRQNFDRAGKEAAYILNYDPTNMMAHRILQQSMLQRALFEQLLNIYDSLLSIHSDNQVLKDIYLNLKNKISAKFYDKAKEKEENFEEKFKEGLKQIREGNMEKAIELFEITYNIPKLKRRSAIKLIECYLAVNLLDKAEEYFKKLNINFSLMNEELKNICYLLGKMNEQRGNYQKALYYYDLICKVDIGFRDAFDRFEEIFTNLKRGKEG